MEHTNRACDQTEDDQRKSGWKQSAAPGPSRQVDKLRPSAPLPAARRVRAESMPAPGLRAPRNSTVGRPALYLAEPARILPRMARTRRRESGRKWPNLFAEPARAHSSHQRRERTLIFSGRRLCCGSATQRRAADEQTGHSWACERLRAHRVISVIECDQLGRPTALMIH
jgi:hypothetical protein